MTKCKGQTLKGKKCKNKASKDNGGYCSIHKDANKYTKECKNFLELYGKEGKRMLETHMRKKDLLGNFDEEGLYIPYQIGSIEKDAILGHFDDDGVFIPYQKF